MQCLFHKENDLVDLCAIIAVPLASEVLPDTLAGKLWKTWPRKNGFKQFPKPGQLTWEDSAYGAHMASKVIACLPWGGSFVSC